MTDTVMWEDRITGKQCAEELFRRKVSEDVRKIREVFTDEEHLRIAFVPLVYTYIAGQYAEKCRRYSAEHRIGLLKDTGRRYDRWKDSYRRTLEKDLSRKQVDEIEKDSRLFMDTFSLDFLKLYFSVNNIFKKQYPNYPYGDMRSDALCGLIMIEILEAHNREIDEMIVSRMGERSRVLQYLSPHASALMDILGAYAGVWDSFRHDDINVELAARVIRNRVLQMKFNIMKK